MGGQDGWALCLTHHQAGLELAFPVEIVDLPRR